MIGLPSPSSSLDHIDTWGKKRKKRLHSLDQCTLKWNVGHHPATCQEYTLTVGIMQELGLWLQMTKWGNLIKYRICKSICAEDYKGSASLNPQSDISPNGSYINRRWTRRAFLKRPSLHFLKHSLMEWMYVTGLQPLCPQSPGRATVNPVFCTRQCETKILHRSLDSLLTAYNKQRSSPFFLLFSFFLLRSQRDLLNWRGHRATVMKRGGQKKNNKTQPAD